MSSQGTSQYATILSSTLTTFLTGKNLEAQLPHILSLLREQKLLESCMMDPSCTKAVEKWCKVISDAVGSRNPPVQWTGLQLLEETIKYCNYEKLTEHVSSWMNSLLEVLNIKKVCIG